MPRSFTREGIVLTLKFTGIQKNRELTEVYLKGTDESGAEVKVGPILRSPTKDPLGDVPYRNDFEPLLHQVADIGKDIPESYSGLLQYMEKALKNKTIRYIQYVNQNGFTTRCWQPQRFAYILEQFKTLQEQEQTERKPRAKKTEAPADLA